MKDRDYECIEIVPKIANQPGFDEICKSQKLYNTILIDYWGSHLSEYVFLTSF